MLCEYVRVDFSNLTPNDAHLTVKMTVTFLV